MWKSVLTYILVKTVTIVVTTPVSDDTICVYTSVVTVNSLQVYTLWCHYWSWYLARQGRQQVSTTTSINHTSNPNRPTRREIFGKLPITPTPDPDPSCLMETIIASFFSFSDSSIRDDAQIHRMQTSPHLTNAVIVINVELFADDKRQQIVHPSVVRVRRTDETDPERRRIGSVRRRTRRPRVFGQLHQTIDAFARSKVSPYVVCNIRLQNAATAVNLLKIRRRRRHLVSYIPEVNKLDVTP